MSIENIEDKEITCWFSCGAASAVATKRTIELYGDKNKIRVVNNPIAEEDEDNRRFLQDVEKWLGVEIELAINPKYPNHSCYEIWDKGYMSGIHGAPCTYELKKKARQIWEKNNKSDYMVLGFTSEEKKRADRFIKFERDNLLTPLIDDNISKGDCYKILLEAGIAIPNIYHKGFPNANCIGCVKATSPTYWNLVRKEYPEVFASRAEQSRRVGCRLTRVKGKRIFLDELDPKAKGRSLKNMDFECGIFCEERSL